MQGEMHSKQLGTQTCDAAGALQPMLHGLLKQVSCGATYTYSFYSLSIIYLQHEHTLL